MLWKKGADGLFIDIFANNPVTSLKLQKRLKNNVLSTRFRQLGNQKFAEKNWQDAMALYNCSLRYAEINTEYVGLAYANRSVCFLKLGMYDKCLIDIELAIKSHYPQHQMAKLEERRSHCLKQINGATPNEATVQSLKGTPTLDFDADENFPGMANVLELKHSKEFGRHFIAKRDIDVGKTIIVDQALVTTNVTHEQLNICSACYKNANNFIACANCSKSLFCDQNCAEDDLHTIECNTNYAANDDLVVFVSRSVLRAIRFFDDAKELMDFVATVISEKQQMKNAPCPVVDMKSKYRLFLELNLWMNEQEKTQVIGHSSEVFEILMKILEVKSKFATQNQKRFLMHLCVMHAYIVFSNSYKNGSTGGIFLLLNHFNHSCAPNALVSYYENKAVVITSRRIKKGDQLFTTYGTFYLQTVSRIERQEALYQDFGFWCKCEKCENKKWPVTSDPIQCDPSYQRLLRIMQDTDFGVLQQDLAKCSEIKQGFLDILIKYSDFPWSTQLDWASDFYQHLSIETLY